MIDWPVTCSNPNTCLEGYLRNSVSKGMKFIWPVKRYRWDVARGKGSMGALCVRGGLEIGKVKGS